MQRIRSLVEIQLQALARVFGTKPSVYKDLRSTPTPFTLNMSR